MSQSLPSIAGYLFVCCYCNDLKMSFQLILSHGLYFCLIQKHINFYIVRKKCTTLFFNGSNFGTIKIIKHSSQSHQDYKHFKVKKETKHICQHNTPWWKKCNHEVQRTTGTPFSGHLINSENTPSMKPC